MRTRMTISLILISSILNAQKIHLLIFATDKRSDDIYISCQKDKKRILAEAKTIAKEIGYSLTYYNTKFSKESLNTTINKLDAETNDVIIFYFSGHGNNYNNNEFPNLNFYEKNSYSELNLMSIHKKLKAKKGRFLLTIGDLCNNIAKEFPKKSFGLSLTKRSLGYIKLFKYHKGDIIITSSKKSQYSWCNNFSGGYFTRSFLWSLNKNILEGNYKWEEIIYDASIETRRSVSKYVKENQEPFFKINIDNVSQKPTSPFFDGN